MIDIVKSLRRIAEEGYRFAGDAADEIERLRSRLEAAEKSDAESLAMYRKARDERDALRAKIEAAEKERDNANAASVNIALEAERLQCENDALRAALQHEADCVEAAKAEIEALRAKIEAVLGALAFMMMPILAVLAWTAPFEALICLAGVAAAGAVSRPSQVVRLPVAASQ